MRLLTFQATRFAWTAFQQTLPDGVADPPAEGPTPALEDVVVAFLHVEPGDVDGPDASRAFKHTLKHLKWIANKRGWANVCLHSFAHLGGDTAPAAGARGFLGRLAERLEATGYSVHQTPFGWFSSWEIAVLGDSLAKVYRAVETRAPQGADPAPAP